ncbi:MAG: Holliday junction resolvase RuvX [Egibacteraceae bacterium]
MGRSLGVDVGTVRVGLALSDPDATVATPIATVPASADVADLATAVAAVAAAHEARHVVVGLPRGMSGRDTASTARARAVADALRSHGLDVDLWDERLSSAEAERLLLAAGRRRKQRRVERDRVAATIILQGWLDAHRLPRE